MSEDKEKSKISYDAMWNTIAYQRGPYITGTAKSISGDIVIARSEETGYGVLWIGIQVDGELVEYDTATGAPKQVLRWDEAIKVGHDSNWATSTDKSVWDLHKKLSSPFLEGISYSEDNGGGNASLSFLDPYFPVKLRLVSSASIEEAKFEKDI